MYAGEQPRVRANRQLYSGVQNLHPSSMSIQEKAKVWLLSNGIT